MERKANHAWLLGAATAFFLQVGGVLATDCTDPQFNGGMVASINDSSDMAIQNSTALLSCIRAAFNSDGLAAIPYPTPVQGQQPVYWLNPISIPPLPAGPGSVTIVTSGLLTDRIKCQIPDIPASDQLGASRTNCVTLKASAAAGENRNLNRNGFIFVNAPNVKFNHIIVDGNARARSYFMYVNGRSSQPMFFDQTYVDPSGQTLFGVAKSCHDTDWGTDSCTGAVADCVYCDGGNGNGYGMTINVDTNAYGFEFAYGAVTNTLCGAAVFVGYRITPDCTYDPTTQTISCGNSARVSVHDSIVAIGGYTDPATRIQHPQSDGVDIATNADVYNNLITAFNDVLLIAFGANDSKVHDNTIRNAYPFIDSKYRYAAVGLMLGDETIAGDRLLPSPLHDFLGSEFYNNTIEGDTGRPASPGLSSGIEIGNLAFLSKGSTCINGSWQYVPPTYGIKGGYIHDNTIHGVLVGLMITGAGQGWSGTPRLWPTLQRNTASTIADQYGVSSVYRIFSDMIPSTTCNDASPAIGTGQNVGAKWPTNIFTVFIGQESSLNPLGDTFSSLPRPENTWYDCPM